MHTSHVTNRNSIIQHNVIILSVGHLSREYKMHKVPPNWYMQPIISHPKPWARWNDLTISNSFSEANTKISNPAVYHTVPSSDGWGDYLTKCIVQGQWEETVKRCMVKGHDCFNNASTPLPSQRWL